MDVVYGSAEDVRIAAAKSLGYMDAPNVGTGVGTELKTIEEPEAGGSGWSDADIIDAKVFISSIMNKWNDERGTPSG